MKVSISLETCKWMQCGPSHVKLRCNVDPPHLHILNVDVMWSNVDVLWSNVDFHILNENCARDFVSLIDKVDALRKVVIVCAKLEWFGENARMCIYLLYFVFLEKGRSII